jgi:predicted transcriptional regulator
MDDTQTIFVGADAEAEEKALAEAEADRENGRLISHEAMRKWLLSWGTDNVLPPPECDYKRP